MNCFGAVNPLLGGVIQMTTREDGAPAFTKFLGRVIREYPKEEIWVYTDSLPVHKSGRGKGFLQNHPRVESVEVSASLLPRPQSPRASGGILRGENF